MPYTATTTDATDCDSPPGYSGEGDLGRRGGGGSVGEREGDNAREEDGEGEGSKNL